MPPAAGFGPMSGTSGRLMSAIVADDTTTDLPVAAGVGTITTAVEITGWEIQVKTESGKVVTVENPADGNRVISTLRLRGGIGEWTAKITGVVNSDSGVGASTAARFPVGSFIVANLLRHKTSAYGIYGATLKVISFDSAGAATDNNPQSFTVQCEGHGILPAPSFS